MLRTISASLLVLVLLVAGCRGQKGENAVQTKVESTQETLNQQDAQALSELFTPDATFTNLSTHEAITGGETIASFIVDQLQQAQNPKVYLSINRVESLTNGHVAETGFSDWIMPDQSRRRFAFKAEFVEQNGIWKISDLKEIEAETPPSNYEKLKEFDWLIGSWQSQDADTHFGCTYSWDDSKNFLVQKFSSDILGYNQLSGQQIIFWDPIKKRVRSMIFDSDGGYGECSWYFDTDNPSKKNIWYASVLYTLADGTKASATHSFTKVDENTYLFSSESRDINGRILPNVGPFKVVRVV